MILHQEAALAVSPLAEILPRQEELFGGDEFDRRTQASAEPEDGFGFRKRVRLGEDNLAGTMRSQMAAKR